MTLETLEKTAQEISDNEAAQRLQEAKQRIFSKTFANDLALPA